MADGTIVSTTDLSSVIRAVNSIGNAVGTIDNNISVIGGEIDVLNVKQDQLENDIKLLMQLFNEYVEADKKQKNLQLAETRLGNIRQDLQIKYGYYAEVRRMSVGILQGVDHQLISEDTLRYSTEEVMIKAPGYWLAPVLVTLSSWIRNDKNTCGKALKESLKRDDYKTTLFFTLLMRRLNRSDASLKWLERYFLHQDPQNLDREFIMILEAVTTGIFNPAGRTLMMQNVKQWLDKMTESDIFINQQKDKWIEFFSANTGIMEVDKFPLLKKFSDNWEFLKLSMEQCKSYNIIQNYFNNILQNNQSNKSTILLHLDETLSRLVTNFDDEELPMRKQERLNELIIEREGDRTRAEQMMIAEEEIYNEKVDFLQLLTNSAFNPENSGSTKSVQALAVSISQPWIIESYESYTATVRNNIPQKIELSIDGFKTSTTNGSDENEQIVKQSDYYNNLLEKEKQKIKFPILKILLDLLIVFAGIALLSSSTPVGTIVILIGILIAVININTFKSAEKKLIESFEERQRKAKEVLRGCLAESVDFRKELTDEDSNAEKVREILKSVTPEDFSSFTKDISRNIIK